MPKEKNKESEEVLEKESTKRGSDDMYKGYSISWLRKEPTHPHFYLVEEYDNRNKKEVK